MSLKTTNIEMDWTDTGARVLSSIPLPCPRCQTAVEANVEHLCGDKAPGPKKKRSRKEKPRG
jgi:hypothetical protein